MAVESFIGLVVAMLVVALIPGPAVFTVMSISLVSGFKQGAYLTAGLVAADYIFIVLAVSGLTALTGAMGDAFRYVKYACALYLAYIGLKLLITKIPNGVPEPNAVVGRSNFVTGLMITLSNPKAILFYSALFPTFVEPARLKLVDVAIIMLLSTLVFGSVNLVYAWLAVRSSRFIKPGQGFRMLNYVSGSVLVAMGVAVAAKS